ncbi:ABC transporter permease [Streptosporangium lutulentum]|uniref:Transport permease protein n=1 Tax=Streptosporangium lutulentum TaxID=1461250 RepID=A0ABT9QSY4_9ACTN|nr:ABC transporter permease [Streptosporangium lutulentum]MDP9849854.1 lipooligosaccharide transport system permease protein [Streptosporangium lutulentum]
MPMFLREFSSWMLRYRRTWKSTIVISVANPLLFLVAIGAGLGQLVDPSSLGGLTYLEFFAPGILAAAAMQNAYIEAAFVVHGSLRQDKSYLVAAATPLEPRDIMAGHMLFMAFRIGTSALAFAAVMAALGATRSPWAVLTVPAALLTGMAFAAPLAAWTVTVGRFGALNTVFRFVLMPMYLFSGTFFGIETLPDWLRPLAYVLPLWHGVDLCRTLSLGTATLLTSAIHVGYLAALTAGGVAVALVTYRRHIHV